MISLREMELTVGQTIVESLDGATLEFDGIEIVVPCTFTPIVKDLERMNASGGLSSLTAIGIVLFRAALVSGIDDEAITKGVPCTLKPTPTSNPIKLQLWTGGLMPGAGLYKWMLVDRNYKG